MFGQTGKPSSGARPPGYQIPGVPSSNPFETRPPSSNGGSYGITETASPTAAFPQIALEQAPRPIPQISNDNLTMADLLSGTSSSTGYESSYSIAPHPNAYPNPGNKTLDMASMMNGGGQEQQRAPVLSSFKDHGNFMKEAVMSTLPPSEKKLQRLTATRQQLEQMKARANEATKNIAQNDYGVQETVSMKNNEQIAQKMNKSILRNLTQVQKFTANPFDKAQARLAERSLKLEQEKKAKSAQKLESTSKRPRGLQPGIKAEHAGARGHGSTGD